MNMSNRRWPSRTSLVALLLATSAAGAPTLQNLNDAFDRGQWDAAANLASEILATQPTNATAKIKGAFALFERGYTNSALLFLKKLTPAEWQKTPQGPDRFVEIVSLFQKKVPSSVLPGRIDQANIERVSPFLRNEIRYAKGREALSRRDYKTAQELFSQISRNSRFYSQSRYHLASMAARVQDYEGANRELSRLFEPSVLDQTSEFWRDLSTRVTSHWGASLSTSLDADPILKSRYVGEMGYLGLARVAYAQKRYEQALSFYDRIPKGAKSFARANLEKIWSLINLERPEEAQRAAAELSEDDTHFESVEARPLRALILADTSKTEEARAELQRFFDLHERSKDALQRFWKYGISEGLPSFLQTDLKNETRVTELRRYQEQVRKEIELLSRQDSRILPLYPKLASALEPQIAEGDKEIARVTGDLVNRRLADLERLYIQAKLILAETYLEDREKLRAEFKDIKSPSEEKQKDHDERLVKLIQQAIAVSSEAQALMKNPDPALLFRQVELIWELSVAEAIVAQGKNDRAGLDAADALKKKALGLAESLDRKAPDFDKHAQVLFFVGFAQMELGREAQSVTTLERYLKLYPRHFHSPDALRILGDLRFDRNDFAGAQTYYRRILEFRDSPIVGYSLYKLGWCSYNLSNYPKAILALEKAILWAKQVQGEEQSLNLTREARRDLVQIYAEVGDFRKAVGYFKSVFGDEAIDVTKELAKELDSTGQFEKSAEIYKVLIAMRPSSAENLGFQTAIVKGNYKLRKWADVVKESGELTDRYKELIYKPSDNETAVDAEKTIRETALAQHYELKRSDVPEDATRIMELDKKYLAGFEEWPTSQEPLYVLAVYQLDKGRIDESADSFQKHWNRFGDKLKEPLKEEALRNLLYTLEKVAAKEKESDKLTPVASDVVKYTVLYNELYPKTKYSRPIAMLRASTYFRHNQIDRGIEASQEVLDENANDESGKQAFKNLRVAYYKKKDWKKVYEWSSTMLNRPEMQAHASDLRQIRGEAAFLHAEGLEGDQDASAAEFMKIADDPQMTWLRDKALYNAFVRYEKSGNKPEALAIAARLQKTSPQFEGLKAASGVRSALYSEAGDYENALPLLKDFLAHPDKDARPEAVAQAKLNAGLISEALGQSESATRYFREYLAKAEDGAGKEEAKRGLQRIQGAGGRAPASVPPTWEALNRARAEYEKAPLPAKGDLPTRIKGGGAKLEQVSRQLLQLSTSPGVAPLYAFEAYCSVPFLYEAYGKGIAKLGNKGPAELKTELSKVAAPIEARARELGGECLKRGMEAEHDGPLFRRVLSKWGWQADTALAERYRELIAALQKGGPWLEPAPIATSEAEIIARHLKGDSSPDTWYTLARLRFDRGKLGLSRLTLIDALSKSPPSTARLLNALALIESKRPEPRGTAALFEKAGTEGSGPAWVNLALYHLKGGRIDAARTPLRQALEKGAFENNDELAKAVKTVTAEVEEKS